MSKNVNIKFGNENIFIRKSAGTHIPVLRAIPQQIDVKSVFEYGTGIFSLSTFLDKKYYSNLKSISSFEKNNLWIEYMKSKFNDSRWHINREYTGGSIADLIFVDGDKLERKMVLGTVCKNAKIVVLHDYNIEYNNCKAEIDGYKYKFVYLPPVFNSTAILSNVLDVSKVDWKIKWDNDFFNWEIT